MNIKTISLISKIATLFLFSFNHLPLVTIKEVLVEMVDVADIAEEVHVVDEEEEEAGTEKVGEVKFSKQTANRRLIAKVGKAIHFPHNLLSHPSSQILLHFLLRNIRPPAIFRHQ